MDSTELKVRELLKEVRLDYSPHFSKLVDHTVSAIKTSFDKIPNDFKVTADIAPNFVRDIAADKVDFKFKKPSFVQIGGSYSIQSLARPELNVDLIVRLPKECFHEKDYLNYRYHAKRCLYLCVIKKYLETSPLIGKVEWSTFRNEARKVLIVCPAAKIGETPGIFVRIIPSASSLFSISKLNMKRNNIHKICPHLKIFLCYCYQIFLLRPSTIFLVLLFSSSLSFDFFPPKPNSLNFMHLCLCCLSDGPPTSLVSTFIQKICQ